MISREMIAEYAYAYEGDWSRISRALSEQPASGSFCIREKYITILDEAYPKELKDLRYPPWILFYEGDISLLAKPKVTIIGSRSLTPYGYHLTRTCAAALRESYVLVSGLAAGADGCVHRTALEGGHTIGVIGSGLSFSYPEENRDLYDTMRKSELILSEYPNFTGVRKHHFPWRNRILAALGEFLVVTEARERSGTSLTVNEALALGRDVWCCPHRFDEESGMGCNRMIAEGAYMLYDSGQLKILAQKNLHG